jgi:type II secretory pathway pseudopilin PulG
VNSPVCRKGSGFLEVIVGVALFALIVTALQGIFGGSQRATDKVSLSSEAMRSALTVTEFLRYDTGRILLRAGEDLNVGDDGHRLDLTISGPSDPDLTKFNPVKLSYYLSQPVGRKGARRLIREDQSGPRFLESCYVKDFSCRLSQPSDASSGVRAFLEVTLVGIDGPDVRASYVTSCALPLRMASEPLPYQLIVGPVERE